MNIRRIASMLISPLIALVLVASVPGGEAKAEGSAILGFLTCTKTGQGMSYLVFSTIPVNCTYDGVGGPQNYTGHSGILLGVDLEIEKQAVLVYAVIGGSSVSPGGLAGSYGGAKASATLGIGPAVQGGLAGIGNGFELVPLGVGGQFGIGVTGGIGYLQITYVAPEAAAAPPPPPPPPAAPAPPPAVSRTFIVYFDFDKANLTAGGKSVVDAAAALAKENVVMHIQVNGYTDTSGTKTYNMALSRRRADAVRGALLGDGVASDRIATAGYGEQNLRVPTPDGVKEPQNRRAEILITP